MNNSGFWRIPLLVLAALVFVAAAPLLARDKGPLTVAESSGYQSTSRYADVMAFIRDLQQISPLVRLETICRSAEGRDIPLLVLADPPVTMPSDVERDGRAVVYIQANIHAGEVEGKEASLMLARDILLKKSPDVLDKLVVLIAPIFNADGNEKISPDNRRQQNGPVNGVGIRYDGLNLDLNRDAMKLESPEMRGMVRNVLGRWDPVLAVDCHTTNGFFHQEPVTFTWAPVPNSDPDIRAFLRDELQTAVETRMREVHKIQAIPYGDPVDFRNIDKGLETFGPEPHYFTNYVGLRNRLSILNENYNHADFRTRVRGCYGLLESILTYVHAHTGEVLELVSQADRRTVERGLKPSPSDRLGLTFEAEPVARKIAITIFEMEIKPREGTYPEIKQTDRTRDLVLPYFADYAAKTSVSFPAGYFITVPDEVLVGKLLQHGLVVGRLLQPVTAEVEAFQLQELKTGARPFQGHWMDQVKGDYVPVRKEFAAGTYFVSTAQPLGSLAADLLEPMSDDVPQWSRGLGECPVYRLLQPVDLPLESVR
jgi:hypothetical protein